MPEPQPQAAGTQKKPAAEGKAAPQIKTCAACSKPLKKVKRYYRNGSYYCNKNCWRSDQKKEKAGQTKEG